MTARIFASLPQQLALIAVCLVSAAAFGEDFEPTRQPTDRFLEYRRWLVPKDSISDLTHGYMPLKRDEFAELLQQLRSQQHAADHPVTRVAAADYHAVFDGRGLLTGEAELTVVHSAEGTSVLSLDPCRLAMGPAVWKRNNASTTATTGVDRTGRVVALVEQSGRLSFSWSLATSATSWQHVTFDLQLAKSPRNRLIVELPAGWQLTADRGLVTHRDRNTASQDEVDDLSSATNSWTVQLGGETRCQLTIKPRQTAERQRQGVSAQQQSTYQLADDGFQLRTTCQYNIADEPVREFTIELDPQLQIVDVQLDAEDVPWVIVPGSDTQKSRLHLQLNAPLPGADHEVVIDAVGPVRTGATWQLPGLTILDAFWRQGTITLATPRSLILEQLQPNDVVELDLPPVPPEEPVMTKKFQMFSPTASIAIRLSRRGAEIVADMGVTVDLEPGTLTAQSIIDLRCQSGRRFVLEADVPNAWTIDGIEAEPPEAVEGFQFSGYRAGKKRLQIHLGKALQMDRSVRLIIRSHRTPALVLRPEHFRPLNLLDVEVASHYVAIAPDSRFRLDLKGDAALNRLAPDKLPPLSRTRIQPRDGGLVFADDAAAESLVITIARENPSYSAVIRVDAEIEEETLTESYRILCTPESTPLQQLLIHLSEARSEEIDWQMLGSGSPFLGVRRLTPQEQRAARLGRPGETWELLLRSPRSEAFEVFGRRRHPREISQAVALAALPSATTQEGSLTVRVLEGQPLSISTRQVKKIPASPAADGQYPTVRGRFRYDPSRNAQVVLQQVRGPDQPSALWAWQCFLHSQLAPTGESVHRAVYRLENWGASEIPLRLPEDCSLQSAEVNGIPADVQDTELDDGPALAISLPALQRYPTILVTYSKQRSALGLAARIAAPYPRLEIPVLEHRWRVTMPPGYRPHLDDSKLTPVPQPRLSWQQRLFGPLAAAPHEEPFRLFSLADWSHLADRLGRSARPSPYARQFLVRLDNAYQELTQSDTDAALRWRALLSHYLTTPSTEVGDSDGPEIMLDTLALAEAGFSSDQRLPTPVGQSAVERASSLFAASGLVLLSYKHQLVVTTPWALSRHLDSLQPVSDRVVATVQPGSLLAQQFEAGDYQAGTNALSLRKWLDDVPISPQPWAARATAKDPGLTSCLWPTCEITVTDKQQAQLLIRYAAIQNAMSWPALLITTGLVSCLCFHRPSRFVLTALVTAAVALVVPISAVPVTAGIFLGTLLGGLATLVASLSPPKLGNVDDRPGVVSSRVASTATVILLLIGILVLAWPASGGFQENTDGEDTASGSGVFSVLVPVDDELRPTGEYDYLPQEFYDAIFQLVKQGSSGGRGWLIRSALYQPNFAWRRSQSELELTSMTAVFQLEALQPSQQVDFPWQDKTDAVDILEARLAGQPLELRWNAERTSFGLTLSTVGVSQLELVLRPRTRRDSDWREISFPIPVVPRSRLQIGLPTDAGTIDLPTCMGGSVLSPESGELTATLGPSPELKIRWQTGSPNLNSESQPVVEQLLWMKVDPSDSSTPVTIESTLRIRANDRALSSLRIISDPRLRLLPLGSDELDLFRPAEVEAGSHQKISLRLREPQTGDIRVRLRFAWEGVSAVGNLSFPYFDLDGCRVTRRWWAFSSAPSLEFTPFAPQSLTPIGTAEFLAAWGRSAITPQLTYRDMDSAPGWYANVRTRQARSQAEQQVDVTVSQYAMDWSLEAQITTSGAPVHQHRLRIPPRSKIEAVTVTSEDTDIVASAHQTQDGIVTLFLSRGVQGEYRLDIRGTKEIASDEDSIPLPQLCLLDVTIASNRLNLYRRPDVLVAVNIQSPVAAIHNPADIGLYRESFGRLIASYDLAEHGICVDLDGTLQLRPNHPATDVKLVTTLHREDGSWQAQVDLDMQLTEGATGLLDEIRLRISPEWLEPTTVIPAARYFVKPIPGQKDRILVLRPSRPAADRLTIQLSSKLDMGTNDRVHSPAILPLDAANVEQYLVLPTQLDQQRIDWVTSGLQPIPWQQLFGQDTAESESQAAFRVWSKPRATIANVQRIEGNRRIRLADVQISLCGERGAYGVVSFQLEPAGNGNCELVVPQNCNLLMVTVEGIPATPAPLGDRRWTLHMGPDHVPQDVVVVFRLSSLDSADREQQLTVPWIKDFDVQQTIWSVRHGTVPLQAKAGNDGQLISGSDADHARLNSIAELIDSASIVVIDNPPDQVRDWYLRWITHLAQAAARLRPSAIVGSESPGSENILQQTDMVLYDQQVDIADSLGMSEIFERVMTNEADFLAVDETWPLPEASGMVTDRFVFEAAAPSIRLTSTSKDQRSIDWLRWIMAVSLFGIAVSVVAAERYRVRLTRLAHMDEWPYFSAVCLGLAWWLWCVPSLLGWLIVCGAIWAAIRPPTPCRPVKASSGSITRQEEPLPQD
jgi:hypothetical protein